MLKNGEVRFVIEDGIKDIGGIADGGRNDFGAILGKLIAAPGVKRDALPIAKVAG